MPLVCGIKFRGGGKIYYFAPGDVPNLQANDYVIVETARGKELARVAQAAHEVPETQIVGELKPICRRALSADLVDAERYRHQEAEACAACREQVARAGLPMKVVNAEYSFDGTRLTFLFSSEQRVDFRELVRELAHIFKTRIELRQIGVRDEAKILGGMGKCGRPLCCATWLPEFYPVSIRMAKQQDLPLSPMEISGCCGRLLCCLSYENDMYQEFKGRFPKVGKALATPVGTGKVIRISVLRETVSVLMEDGSIIELTPEQLAGTAPIRPPEEMGGPDEETENTPRTFLESPGSIPTEDDHPGDEAASAWPQAKERPSPPQELPALIQDRRRRTPTVPMAEITHEPASSVEEPAGAAEHVGPVKPRRRRAHHPRSSAAQPTYEQSQAPIETARRSVQSPESGRPLRRRPPRRGKSRSPQRPASSNSETTLDTRDRNKLE